MSKSNYRKECPNSYKIGVLRIVCAILALATIVCAVGWIVTANRPEKIKTITKDTCIGMREAEITHCEVENGKCYFYVLTDDFISCAVEIPEDRYGMYVEGDVILVDVMANSEGEKRLYFSEENA
jgi:hypothetical protein